MKVSYSEQLRTLRLKPAAHTLINTLRADIGEDFLKEVRVVLGFHVQRNSFMAGYAMNYLVRGGRGAHTTVHTSARTTTEFAG